MDQFEERLSRLGELSDSELQDLESELVTAFDTADQSGDVDTMSSIADAVDQVRAELSRRGDQATSTPQNADASAPEMMAASAGDPDGEATETDQLADDGEAVAEDQTSTPTEPESPDTSTETTAADTETDVETAASAEVETSDGDGDGETEVAPVEEVDGQADEAGETGEVSEADGSEEGETPSMQETTDAEITADEVPEDHKPNLETTAPVIRAGGDIPGVSAGAELETLDQVADALCQRINSLRGKTGGGGEQIVVASIETTTEDEARTLRRGDIDGNSRKIREVLEMRRDQDPMALTAAANGWCAPRTPIYTLFGLGDTDRPVKDSLPGFNAERGGIIASTPPKLSDAGWGAGVWAYVDGVGWQAASVSASGTPEDNTKVLYDVTCPEEFTADLEAITSMIRVENPMARAYPELVRRYMELAMVAHARFAEERLLRQMRLLTTDNVAENPSIPLGVNRDLLLTLRTIAASFRNRHRLVSTAPLDVWAPAWLRDVMAIDLSLTDDEDHISPSLAEIDAFLRDANVNPVWYLDGMPGAPTSQLFADNHTFPTNAELIVAPPGTYMFLDGGTLDIGVVRDSTLVAANQYVEFTETFEGVAMMGPEALSVTVPVFAMGAAAALVSTTGGVTLT